MTLNLKQNKTNQAKQRNKTYLLPFGHLIWEYSCIYIEVYKYNCCMGAQKNKSNWAQCKDTTVCTYHEVKKDSVSKSSWCVFYNSLLSNLKHI